MIRSPPLPLPPPKKNRRASEPLEVPRVVVAPVAEKAASLLLHLSFRAFGSWVLHRLHLEVLGSGKFLGLRNLRAAQLQGFREA